jgi:hypothetical protein
MKIGIFGFGQSAKRVCDKYQSCCSTIIYDPKINKLDRDIFLCDFIFICDQADKSLCLEDLRSIFILIERSDFSGVLALNIQMTPVELDNISNMFPNMEFLYTANTDYILLCKNCVDENNIKEKFYDLVNKTPKNL